MEQISEIVANDIKNMGYTRVATRSDQERVLVALAEKLCEHGVQVVTTTSPVGES